MAMQPQEQKEHRQTIRERILAALQEAGKEGITGVELSPITWRFGDVIHRLRRDGHIIETVKHQGVEPDTYVYKRGPLPALEAQAAPKAAPMVGICECGHTASQHRYEAHPAFHAFTTLTVYAQPQPPKEKP